MSALHQIRIKWASKRRQISLLVPSFQRTYQPDSKQESEKARGKLKVTLKKMGEIKKNESTMGEATLMKKKQNASKKIESCHLFKTRFHNHDPGILSMRAERRRVNNKL